MLIKKPGSSPAFLFEKTTSSGETANAATPQTLVKSPPK
jgi:hypothetical protein